MLSSNFAEAPAAKMEPVQVLRGGLHVFRKSKADPSAAVGGGDETVKAKSLLGLDELAKQKRAEKQVRSRASVCTKGIAATRRWLA